MDEIKKAKERGCRIIHMNHPEYPERLKNIDDPPRCFYIKGEICPQDSMSLAIVGTRSPTTYGRKVAEMLAAELSSMGFTIVSGMARGIDSFAHRAALKAGGRSIAVLGCGIDIVYPRENRCLMEDIAASGAVLSEFPPGTGPDKKNFPRRNRIISGLSLGTVVIEAAEKSGSLITARLALEQGREVFAVPGNINSPASKGANNLIKQGAKLVSDANDVLEEFEQLLTHGLKHGIKNNSSPFREGGNEDTLSLRERDRVRVGLFSSEAFFASLNASTAMSQRFTKENENGEAKASPTLGRGDFSRPFSSEEEKVYRVLTLQPKHIDQIITESGIEAQKVIQLLFDLEIKGIAEQLPGNCYVRASLYE